MITPKTVQFLAAISTLFAAGIASAATPQLALWANRSTVDTDGDGVPDLVDFAPGVFDNQMDTDNDGIGDPIDSMPSTSMPYYGDTVLGLTGPYTINAGGTVNVSYNISLPVDGDWGHIDIDFGGDSVYDATYFGPLTTSFLTMPIPASFFVGSQWDLNTNGNYALYAKAFGPGRQSQYDTITNAIVVPEPATASLVIGALSLARRRRIV
jgi:hypothetical protein